MVYNLFNPLASYPCLLPNRGDKYLENKVKKKAKYPL